MPCLFTTRQSRHHCGCYHHLSPRRACHHGGASRVAAPTPAPTIQFGPAIANSSASEPGSNWPRPIPSQLSSEGPPSSGSFHGRSVLSCRLWMLAADSSSNSSARSILVASIAPLASIRGSPVPGWFKEHREAIWQEAWSGGGVGASSVRGGRDLASMQLRGVFPGGGPGPAITPLSCSRPSRLLGA